MGILDRCSSSSPALAQRLAPAFRVGGAGRELARVLAASAPTADLGWDKANHFTAFGTLAFIGLQGLRAGPGRRWIVLAMLLAYGVLIELVQSQIPGRDAEAMDVVADMIGAVIGVGLHALVLRVIGPRVLPAR